MSALVASVAATVLLAAAALKAADRPGSTVALGTYGLEGRGADAAWLAAIALEAAIGAGLLAGSAAAAWAGAGLLSAFAVVQALALAAGRGGAPCGCFGARGGLSARSSARAALLGLACAGVALAGAPAPGLAGALVALLAVGVAVGAERWGWLAPGSALAVAGEGPAIGSQPLGGGTGPALAVFTSEGCRLCRRLRPALAALAGELEVRIYDERRDAEAWSAANVPGAPYVVALHGGVVRAKGSVNTRAQVHSVLAEAERSRLEEQAAGFGDPTPTRRTLLAQLAGAAAVAIGATALVRPGEAEAYHFCGHIYTTDSCPHPTGLPRIDSRGYPLRARDGRAVDDLGRPIDEDGRPVEEDGAPMTDAEGRPLPPASRTKVCTATGRRFGFRPHVDGAWYRCCKGQVRKLVDCCTTGRRRINGDRALTGYCFSGRRVFCVMYYDTRVPCDSRRGRRLRARG